MYAFSPARSVYYQLIIGWLGRIMPKLEDQLVIKGLPLTKSIKKYYYNLFMKFSMFRIPLFILRDYMKTRIYIK